MKKCIFLVVTKHVVVVSRLEYIRKQQVENIKKKNCGITAATIGESVEVDREIRDLKQLTTEKGTSTLLTVMLNNR